MAKGNGNVIDLPGLQDTAQNFLKGVGNLGQYNVAGRLLGTGGGGPPGTGGFESWIPGGGGGGSGGVGGGVYGDEVNRAIGSGHALDSFGNSLLPYATSILNTGFDPQNDLYNRTLQQTTQGERAAQSARGIAMTPLGASLEGDANRNFNIDWQNNLLGRQATAAGAAGGLAGTAGNAMTTGSNLGLGALNQYANLGTQAQNQAQGGLTDMLGYLGLAPAFAGATNQNRGTNMGIIGDILGALGGGVGTLKA